ncbi:MAG TPA: ribosome maturation factor RimM [Alcaligenes sp.]|nr:ribosome maturation factor RimM [Alcaligenes sp.]HRL27306.1 ribosome maturation factor RimM [Alcaligenes sp.]
MKHAAPPDDLVELGRIVSAYGVRGWVKVQPHSMQTKALLNAKTWWIKAPRPGSQAGVFASIPSRNVVSARQHGATIVAQFEGMDDRDLAQAMKGQTVWVSRAEFPQADDNEFYWVDLLGCQFWGEQDGQPQPIGEVVEVLDNGAHAILAVHRGLWNPEGIFMPQLDDKGRPLEELVPFVQAIVHTVDLPARLLHSHWPA